MNDIFTLLIVYSKGCGNMMDQSGNFCVGCSKSRSLDIDTHSGHFQFKDL